MKRRQLLQTGLGVTGLSAFASETGARPSEVTAKPLSIVLTRGHFNEDAWPIGVFGGVELSEGYTKTGYETTGTVPGVDRGCVRDLTVVIHGWNNKADDAWWNVVHYDRKLSNAGYTGTVAGFSWDSHLGTFFDAQDCAKKNGPKLARFLREYRQACPNGVLRLVSHSLGAHVIMSTLKTLAADKTWNTHGFTIDSVHMLGAAIDNEAPTKEWSSLYSAFANEVEHTFNYWNSEDDTLSTWYPGDQPLGESGVESGNTAPPNFTDIQVTDNVGDDHSGYIDALAPMIVGDMYQVARPLNAKPTPPSKPKPEPNPEPKPEPNPEPSVERSLAHPSNYTDASRGAGEINWIVIHAVQGSASGAVSWFQNPSANVSAHYTIARDGHRYQNVFDEDIAWHAGGSNYNDYSIGIEHGGHVDIPYPEAQYRSSAALVKYLATTYDVPLEHPDGIAACDPQTGGGIIGHHQVPEAGCVANDHTDPGSTWDWKRFMALVNGTANGGTDDSSDNGGGGSQFSIGDRVASTVNLNTRSRPGTDSRVLKTMAPGSVGAITDGPTEAGGYTWWKVQWNTGVHGWSAGRYLTPSSGSGGTTKSSSTGPFHDGDRVVPTTNLNTRHRPGTNSRVLETMTPGTVGKIMNGPVEKDGYTWWGVHWLDSDIWGWSAGKYLSEQ